MDNKKVMLGKLNFREKEEEKEEEEKEKNPILHSFLAYFVKSSKPNQTEFRNAVNCITFFSVRSV